MDLIYVRVASRSPERVLSVRVCAITPEPYITVGFNFVSILSLVIIPRKYFGRLTWRLAGVIDQISTWLCGKERCWLFAWGFRVSECSALNSI